MTNYTRGRAVEYMTVHDYESRGWWAVRTAGSHSCVDVIAMRQGEIHLIQCSVRAKGKTMRDFDTLRALAAENNCRAFHAYRDKGLQLEEVHANQNNERG